MNLVGAEQNKKKTGKTGGNHVLFYRIVMEEQQYQSGDGKGRQSYPEKYFHGNSSLSHRFIVLCFYFSNKCSEQISIGNLFVFILPYLS
jgi:hypothetical protein